MFMPFFYQLPSELDLQKLLREHVLSDYINHQVTGYANLYSCLDVPQLLTRHDFNYDFIAET